MGFRLLVQFNLLETKGNVPSRWKSVSLLQHLSFSKAWSTCNLWNASEGPCQSAVNEIFMLKRKIEQSETSIVKLQAHTEKGTCPKDLHYVAKSNITPDEEFKTEINSTKKEPQVKFIDALTKFHYRRIERNNDKLWRVKSNKSRSKKTLNELSITPRAQSNSSTACSTLFYNLSGKGTSMTYSRCGMLTKRRQKSLLS